MIEPDRSGAPGPEGADPPKVPTAADPPVAPPGEPRPWLERIGMAAIAAVLGTLLVVVAIAAFAGGELVLAAMAISGAILTLGIGLLTLVRG